MTGDRARGWTPCRLGRLFAPISITGHTDAAVLSVYRDYGVIPKNSRTDNFNRTPENLGMYQLVVSGDLVVNRMKAWQGSLGVSEHEGIVSPDYEVLRPTTAMVPRYVHALLRSLHLVDEYRVRSTGIRPSQWRLYWEQMKTIEVYLPPLPEQHAIADYLDHETAQIDALIGKQERLIETLRERRAAVVSHAVMSGLDRDVSTKKSGIGVYGQIPSTWAVAPLKVGFGFQEGPGIMATDFRDEGVPLLRVKSVRTAIATLDGCNYLDAEAVAARWSHFRVRPGDLLVSASASMGTVSEVSELTAGAVPYTGIIRLIPSALIKDFIRWFVVSAPFVDQIDRLKTGSTIQHYGPTHLAQMRLAIPPRDEQRRIASYLDGQTAKIDALIAKAERFIEVSKERRSALITAAVTGQIDVRGRVDAAGAQSLSTSSAEQEVPA